MNMDASLARDTVRSQQNFGPRFCNNLVIALHHLLNSSAKQPNKHVYLFFDPIRRSLLLVHLRVLGKGAAVYT